MVVLEGMEVSEKGGSPSNGIETEVEINPALERRVVLKCDLNIMPPMFMIFMLTFLDRVVSHSMKRVSVSLD